MKNTISMSLTHSKKCFYFIQPSKILILSSSKLKRYLDIIKYFKYLELDKFDITNK